MKKRIKALVLVPVMGVFLMMHLAEVSNSVPGSRPVNADASELQQVNKDSTSYVDVLLVEPYYGMHFVPSGDLAQVKAWGTDVVLAAFQHNGTLGAWEGYLDAADAQGIKVIAWLWPEGWSWDGSAWQINQQARLFLETVADHPALLAVYALHEPYWNGCWGCGYTTAEQQALYDAIKAIADVPIHSAVDSMSFWTDYSEETAFADGICDYCETWYHPFLADGTYEREKMIEQLEANLVVAQERAPNSKVVWSMQTFAQEGAYRMPTAEEMQDMASIIYSRSIDGALWYPWNFGELYSDSLANHSELYPVIEEIYREIVFPIKFPYHLYLPIVSRGV